MIDTTRDLLHEIYSRHHVTPEERPEVMQIVCEWLTSEIAVGGIDPKGRAERLDWSLRDAGFALTA